jgi:hypothetical protein
MKFRPRPVNSLPTTDDGPPAPDSSIEVYKAIRAHELMLNQATSQFEHAAAAPLVLLNGGAAVAYLTLLGAVSDPQTSKLALAAPWAVTALVAWALGLITAQAAVTFGLASQRAYSKAQRMKREDVERHLLEHQPALLGVIALRPPDPCAREKERNRGKRNANRLDAARLISSVCFLAGVVFAAVSIG